MGERFTTKNLGMKNRDKVVILLFLYSIPSYTSQIGGNRKLVKWVVLDGMGFITIYSIPLIFYKTKQWNVASSHPIPFHSTTLHQSKHTFNKQLTYLDNNQWLGQTQEFQMLTSTYLTKTFSPTLSI